MSIAFENVVTGAFGDVFIVIRVVEDHSDENSKREDYVTL